MIASAVLTSACARTARRTLILASGPGRWGTRCFATPGHHRPPVPRTHGRLFGAPRTLPVQRAEDGPQKPRRQVLERLGQTPSEDGLTAAVWAAAWELFEQDRRSVELERDFLQANRVRDEYQYARRFRPDLALLLTSLSRRWPHRRAMSPHLTPCLVRSSVISRQPESNALQAKGQTQPNDRQRSRSRPRNRRRRHPRTTAARASRSADQETPLAPTKMTTAAADQETKPTVPTKRPATSSRPPSGPPK